MGNLLKDIKLWLHMLEEHKVSHILREGSGSTDFMEERGFKGIKTEYVMCNLPSELYNRILLDSRSCGLERKH